MKIGIKKVLILLLFLFPLCVNAHAFPEISSRYALIYNITDDEILYEKNSNDRVAIASLTKIVTTITALENITDINQKVKLTREMIQVEDKLASKAGLKAKMVVTYEDLLYASLIPSGADATNSIAISLFGSIEAFVDKMNEFVQRLGLKNTHFVNTTGLDAEGHYSSANDIAKILAYALQNPIFKRIYTTKDYTLSNGLKVTSTLYHYNESLNLDLSNILGSKTGFTTNAGYCLSSLIKDDGKEIIVIVLNAPFEEKIPYHLIDTINLTNDVISSYNYIPLITNNTVVKSLKIYFSNYNSYDINGINLFKYLPYDYDKAKFVIKYDGKNYLSYNNKKGDTIGTVSYYYDNELLASKEYKLDQDLEMNLLDLSTLGSIFLLLTIPILIFVVTYVFIVLKARVKNDRQIN